LALGFPILDGNQVAQKCCSRIKGSFYNPELLVISSDKVQDIGIDGDGVKGHRRKGPRGEGR
jgi:hypothetical protein